MSNFVSELEGDFSNQGGNQQGGQQGGFDNQQQGGQGGNFDNQQQGGGNDNQQQGGNERDAQQGGQQQQGGGGFMKGLESTGKDAMVDQEVNQFMTKEGVPAGADGFIDNAVNKEFNEYT